MISTMLDRLRNIGVVPALDLGNFSVGVATALVALVSLFVALRASKASNNQKIAQFRQEWIDDLRQHIALFIGATYETLNHALSAVGGENRQLDLDIKHSELKRLESYVVMKLNGHENDHQILARLLAETRGRAAVFGVHGGMHLGPEIDALVDLITDFSRIVYKKEWDRVSDDTYGRGRINRHIRNLVRQRKYATRESKIRERVSTTLKQQGSKK